MYLQNLLKITNMDFKENLSGVVGLLHADRRTDESMVGRA